MTASQSRIRHLRVLILTVMLCWGGLCTAQIYVFGRADYATGNFPSAVATGDFNGDGRLDVAVVNTGDKTVSIRLGNSDSTFQAATDLPTGTTPVAMLVADFNGDGKLDLAVSNFDDATVSIFIGNGDGTFQSRVDYPTDIEARTLAAADLNGDHKLDLLVATGAGTVSVLLGNGNGTFQSHVEFPAAPGAGGGQAGILAIGDFNGDGKMDVAYPDIDNDTVAILLGNGDGTFQPFVQYATARGPDGVTVADFNGDGHLDVAVSSSFENTVSVLNGNGDGTFQAHADSAVGATPGQLVALDLNGDGKTDLAAVNQSCYDGCAGSVSILLGKGDGSFNPHVDYGTGVSPALAVGDFNGDAHPDLALVNGSSNNLQILIGYGDGTFPGSVDVAQGTDSDSIVIADFNGDSYLDLAMDNDILGSVTVLLGDGHGGFPSRIDTPFGGNVAVMTAGDFNRDGKMDVAGTHGGTNNLSVMLGNGDGTFGAPTDFPAGTSPAMISNADLNNDGHLDLIVLDQVVISGQASGAVSILLGNGDGTFKSHVDYPPGGTFIATADLNGDGNLDLVTTNGQTQGAFSVYLGKGDGTFHSAVTYPTNPSPGSVAIGDFNGDGKLDLAVTSFSATSMLSIFLGNGDGTFQPAQQFAAGSFTASAIAGDFNGDGKLDVAISGASVVSILVGNGDGTFQPHLDYDVPQSPVWLAAGDLDGDGGLDLAAVRLSGGSAVSILLNRPVLAVSPTQMNFGTHTIAGTTAEQTLLLSNPGSVPVKFGGALLSGPAGSDFTATVPCAAQIPVGGNCSIPVAFRPIAAGQRNAQLMVTNNAPGSAQIVSLTGKGTGPGVLLSSTTLSFPLQPFGVTSAPLSVTLTNSGDQPVNIGAISIAGPNPGDFAQTNTCGTLPAAIAPGSTCTFNVTFTSSPSGGLGRTANLTITDNTLDSPQSVLLIGSISSPEVNFSPAAATFAPQIVGTTSNSQAITLSNVGNAPLIIQSLQVTGPDAGDFNQTSNCPITPNMLAAAASCTITATFIPSAIGPKTATLTVTHNAPCCGQDIVLNGTGTDFSLATTPASKTINAGQGATLSLSVTPAGGFSELVQLTCSGAPQASTCTVSPSSVTPDGKNPASANVAITTTARAASAGHFAAWAMGMGLLSLILFPRAPRSKVQVGVTSFLVCFGLFLLVGCGGSSTPPPPGTPAGTYTLTVSGSSGGGVRTSTVTLTVN